MIQARITDLSETLDRLLQAPNYLISGIIRAKLPQAAVPGVYLISSPDDPTVIVYAGRTKTKSVLGRLVDHLRCKTPSDLSGMLLRHSECNQDATAYHLRWLQVDNETERAQLELFAISVLRPPFNRYI